MQTVELDDDIYAHLLANVSQIGEDASSILRRLLKLQTHHIPAANGHATPASPSSKLAEYLRSSAHLANRSATDRFLHILAFAHSDKADIFDRILQVSGRRRSYFARSQGEIAESGRSTNPQQIPGSTFWAMTNADTEQKKDILARVLKILGYAPAEVRAAVETRV